MAGHHAKATMNIHWYWPFVRPEELPLARAALMPGDLIVVQSVDREAAPSSFSAPELVVRPDLPDVNRAALNGLGLVPSRAATYVRRVVARRACWREYEFDIVHIHYLNRFTDALDRFPRPLVLSVHDVVPHRSRLGGRIEHRLLSASYRRADLMVVHHRSLADRLITDFGCAARSIEVVPHQVFPVPGGPNSPGERRRVLFFGALRSNKGLEVLAEALPQLRDPEAEITIVGAGEQRLEAMVRTLAARDGRVRAEIGFVSLERKRQLFRSTDLVVLPYTSFASQSGVLHDAYGHGVPVVVSDVGALGQSVREDGTGVVVEPSDARKLAQALELALEPERRRSFAAAARAAALARAPGPIGARLRDLYEALLSGGRSRRG